MTERPGARLKPASSATVAGSGSIMSGESVTASPAEPGGSEEEPNDFTGDASDGWPNMAVIGRTESHSLQRKWPVRRSSVRAHGSAPFAATIAATRHQTAAADACPGRPASATARATALNPSKLGGRLAGTRAHSGRARGASARTGGGAHGGHTGSLKPSTSYSASHSGHSSRM
jgi:hypothetical protein